jgi:hypothetical protein
MVLRLTKLIALVMKLIICAICATQGRGIFAIVQTATSKILIYRIS